jgi:hypothetical protein
MKGIVLPASLILLIMQICVICIPVKSSAAGGEDSKDLESGQSSFEFYDASLNYRYSFDRGDELKVISELQEAWVEPDRTSGHVTPPPLGTLVEAIDLNGLLVQVTYELRPGQTLTAWVPGNVLKPSSMDERAPLEASPMQIVTNIVIAILVMIFGPIIGLWLLKQWFGPSCSLWIIGLGTASALICLAFFLLAGALLTAFLVLLFIICLLITGYLMHKTEIQEFIERFSNP